MSFSVYFVKVHGDWLLLWGIPLCMCVIVQCLFSYQTSQGSLRVRVCFLTVHVHRVSVNTWKHVLEQTRTCL